MSYIELPSHLTGISAGLAYRPETAGALMDLAHTLLRGESTLEPWERELIAACVSQGNNCRYCTLSHTAAAHSLASDPAAIDFALVDAATAPISPKLQALLEIAEAVRESGRSMTHRLAERARSEGASDIEIHDTVLIASAFSMYNRYVDGLGTPASNDPADYVEMGERLARQGYQRR